MAREVAVLFDLPLAPMPGIEPVASGGSTADLVTVAIDAPERCSRFTARGWRDGAQRWLADLPGLAIDRLRRAGVMALSDGAACTVEDASRFFSYRRDGVTGRLAAAVWRLP
jgi:copper oxidase (laccase) domain-containing protein